MVAPCNGDDTKGKIKPAKPHWENQMEPAAIFIVLIPLAIIVAIVIRFAAGGLDHDRVRQYVEERGGKLLTAEWAPFGPGWFGEKSDRIYEVRYFDVDGNEHQAYAKTSMWTGVYLTEDRIVKYGKSPVDPEDVESLEEENRRLRMELARLKKNEKDKDSDAIQE
jgi:hypothetical protein